MFPRTLGSWYPNSDTEAFRYPNTARGLGIRTKQGSRYLNKKGNSSDTETPSNCSDKKQGLCIRTQQFGYRDPQGQIVRIIFLFGQRITLHLSSDTETTQGSRYPNQFGYRDPQDQIVRIKFVRIVNHQGGGLGIRTIRIPRPQCIRLYAT